MSTNYLKRFECDEINFADLCSNNESYREIVSVLLGRNTDTFFEECFEKRPALFVRGNTKPSNANILFSKQLLLSTVKKHRLEAFNNFNVVKFNGQQKESITVDSTGNSGCFQALADSFKKGHTVQFFQPQRFSDHLYRVNASFEQVFGSLAGASVYATPPKTQGLAPHYDDVEVFILQLEGSKLWHIWDHSYYPTSSEETVLPLPQDYSKDIERSLLPDISSKPGTGSSSTSISPQLYAEVKLDEGDLLYMPRGTIHEAQALDSFSTHVTISVYQQYNYKNLVSRIMQPLIERAFAKTMSLRVGLPRKLGLFAGSGPALGLRSMLGQYEAQEVALFVHAQAQLRDEFMTRVESAVKELPSFFNEEVVDIAVDQIAADFMANRLPPPNLISTTDEAQIAEDRPSKKAKLSEKQAQDGPLPIVAESAETLFASWQEYLQSQGTWRQFQQQLHTMSEKKKSNQKAKTSSKAEASVSAGNVELIALCDAMSMHAEVVDIDGVQMLAISSARFNSRLEHMGLPLPASFSHDQHSVSSDGSDSESDVVSDDELPPWTVLLPLRLNVVYYILMYETVASGGVTIQSLRQQAYHRSQIDDEEVAEVLLSLGRGGLINKINSTLVSKYDSQDESMQALQQLRPSRKIS